MVLSEININVHRRKKDEEGIGGFNVMYYGFKFGGLQQWDKSTSSK